MVIPYQIDAEKLTNGAMKHLEPYFEQGAEFHGWLSPGLVMGIIMVDLAKELLGPRNLIDAFVETKACIPDAVQLMTACSYGNGWMRVKDWGKVALTLYDKHELDGVRVSLDWEEVKMYPLIERWLMRNGNVDKEEVTREVMKAGRNILAWQRVRVAPSKKIKNAPLAVCSLCGETHPANDGDLCVRCSGRADYYEITERPPDKYPLVSLVK
jgi:formylmethanofuran dehydrogenase subunit E